MTDRLVVSGLPDGRLEVAYRLEGADDAEVYGEPEAFVSPLSEQDLADLTWYLERYLVAPYALYAEKGAEVEARLVAWGEALSSGCSGSAVRRGTPTSGRASTGPSW